MLPNKLCKLAVLSVELYNSNSVLNFLEYNKQNYKHIIEISMLLKLLISGFWEIKLLCVVISKSGA